MGTYAPNVYLVVGEKAAFIDSGYSDDAAVERRLEYLKEIAAPAVEYILLTHSHPDHAGGAGKLKAALGAKVVTHPLERERADSLFSAAVDMVVEEGETLSLKGVELEVIHTPGHSPGHICVYARPTRLLFSGDHVLGLGTTAISASRGDMAQYMASLRKLQEWEISCICPGHGPLVRHPGRKLQELLQHRLEREQQVLDCLSRGKVTIAEMVQEIYPELDSRLYELALEQVTAHLIKLEREGRVVSRQVATGMVYALC
jgi:glyoxylase-like metal-dependent hydrolase (beta-lactamase superfamily II)